MKLLLTTIMLITIQLTIAYNSINVQGNHIINYEKGTDTITYQEAIKFIPENCHVRIDIVKRNNIYYNGYAWYSGRIIIYDGNNMDTQTKIYVMEHEIGHVCAENNTIGTYEDREQNADNYVKGLNQ